MPQTISKVKDDLEVSINSHYSGLSRLSLYEKYISYLYIYISNFRCGYGNNERYPWCYVGDTGSDQWRPCKL